MTSSRRFRKAAATGGALALAGSMSVWVAPAASHAASPPVTVSVDWNNPAGHNFEYQDFFPRTGINVLQGDVVDFKVPAGASSDGLHIVGLLKSGQSVAQAFADPANALVAADPDDGANANPLENLRIFAPSSFTCGDLKTPCVYDGTAQVTSGAVSPGSDFYVKINVASGSAVNVVDFGHPITDPTATVNVVSSAPSTQAALDSAAAAQAASDTSGALAAEAAANVDHVTANANGTKTHHVNVGASTTYVEVMEMLPATVKATHGDKVAWNYGGMSDPHTVQFPAEPQSASVGPFGSAECEGAKGDTPSPAGMAAGPPTFGCASPPAAEVPFLVGAQGTSVIHAPSYRMVASDGGVFDFGQSKFYGSTGNIHLNQPIVATASTGDQKGYFELAADGGMFTWGDAKFFGSMGGKKISAPIIGMLTDPFNDGYVMFGADGAAYPFGPDVPPIPAHLAAPIVGVAGSPGPGAYLVATDGGVFTLNGAPYFGSMGGKHLNQPIVGMASTPDGGGYWLVAKDGGIFSFGDAKFYGSTGGIKLNQPIVGMVATPDGAGYWLVARDGGIFAFGDAKFQGSMGAIPLNKPVVGIDSTFSLGSSGILINIPAGNPNAFPSRTSYTFSFPESGNYTFGCGFHEMMVGTVKVS
jgi:plastocyanin